MNTTLYVVDCYIIPHFGNHLTHDEHLMSDHVNNRPFAYLTYLMKVRDLKIANYKTIHVGDQEYNKDVVSPQGFVFVTIIMYVSYLTCPYIYCFIIRCF